MPEPTDKIELEFSRFSLAIHRWIQAFRRADAHHEWLNRDRDAFHAVLLASKRDSAERRQEASEAEAKFLQRDRKQQRLDQTAARLYEQLEKMHRRLETYRQ